MNFELDKLVEEYRGILEQDGWETTRLTIATEHPKQAEQIIARLKKEGR